jgi:hypothetical protein
MEQDIPRKPRAKGPTSILQKTIDQCRRHYGVELATGVALEAALEPEFWAHVGKDLRPFDRIELMAQDRTFIAELVVLSSGPGFAKVKLLESYDLTDDMAGVEAEESAESPFLVKWNGPSDKYAVIRTSDNMKPKPCHGPWKPSRRTPASHRSKSAWRCLSA